MTPRTSPESERELLACAERLAGRTLAAIALDLKTRLPSDSKRAKGWIGELIERALGASASSLPEPDFPRFGIELKTIPVDRAGRPRESTYVTTVPLVDNVGLTWDESLVRKKLARVLWVPVEAASAIALADRRIGSPLLWSPTHDQEATLHADFDEIMELVCMGQLGRVSARYGTYLQIRPKAAHGRVRTQGIGESGRGVPTLPRGFYLRASFTEEILRAHYALP